VVFAEQSEGGSVARTGEPQARPYSILAHPIPDPLLSLPSSLPDPPQARPRPKGPKAGSIGSIIAVYKSIVSRKIKLMDRSAGPEIWHRSFHESVVRDAKELAARRSYIRNNPGK
jgi:hypothetical protein